MASRIDINSLDWICVADICNTCPVSPSRGGLHCRHLDIKRPLFAAQSIPPPRCDNYMYLNVLISEPPHVLRTSAIRRCESGGHSHMRPMCGHRAAVDSLDVLRRRGLRGGGIWRSASIRVCYDLTADGTEAERTQLITIILNVAAVMHLIFRCIHNIRIDRWQIGVWVGDKRKEKKKGVVNHCVTGVRECLFKLHFTSNEHRDKWSWFLCLTEKTASGRTGR